jgi:hypothetical protein
MSDPRAARNGDRAAAALRRAEHLHSPFGADRFGRAAERIAALTSGIHAVTCDPPTSPNAGLAGGKAPS